MSLATGNACIALQEILVRLLLEQPRKAMLSHSSLHKWSRAAFLQSLDYCSREGFLWPHSDND